MNALSPHHIAVIGSGPAGLMAADRLASSGFQVTLFEKRKALGWKLYVAGGSGLNVSNNLPLESFAQHYTGPEDLWHRILADFSPTAWMNFIETDLGIGTFLGTSGRYFVETMHAAKLLRQWRRRLENLGVRFEVGSLWQNFTPTPGSDQWDLYFADSSPRTFTACILCLGGASYEKAEASLVWPELLSSKGLCLHPFTASNTGYTVTWPKAFLLEAEGEPLKNIELTTQKGQRKGDLVVTHYGLEGTPMYFMGSSGQASLDLKPDLSYGEVLTKLGKGKENFSPLRRCQKQLKLCKASQALIFHLAPKEALQSCEALAATLKAFPIELLQPRPLTEAISSKGGLSWNELDPSFMLKKYPGMFCAGEMIDWDAPTGGFLIQACISQGYAAANSILNLYGSNP